MTIILVRLLLIVRLVHDGGTPGYRLMTIIMVRPLLIVQSLYNGEASVDPYIGKFREASCYPVSDLGRIGTCHNDNHSMVDDLQRDLRPRSDRYEGRHRPATSDVLQRVEGGIYSSHKRTVSESAGQAAKIGQIQ